jgi:hypothetical protein
MVHRLEPIAIEQEVIGSKDLIRLLEFLQLDF